MSGERVGTLTVQRIIRLIEICKLLIKLFCPQNFTDVLDSIANLISALGRSE